MSIMQCKPNATWKAALFTILGVIALVALVPILLIPVLICVSFFDDWNYSRLRSKVDNEMVSAGFLPPIVDLTSYPRQPDLSFESPGGLWTLVAQWVDTRGYNWGLRNKGTGKMYFLVDKIRPDNAFSPRLEVLWSSNGSYVAVTSAWGANAEYIDVINVVTSTPYYTKLNTGSPDLSEKELLSETDNEQYEGWCGKRLKALKWENDTDLDIIVYIDVRIKPDGSERAVAAHETLRFGGDSYEVRSKKYDFYETLPEVD